jgi:Zinc finger, C2H2 type
VRQVILAASCDICNKSYYDDADNKVQTVNFSWDGVDYEVDADAECRTVLTTASIANLIQSGRERPKGKRKDPSKPKAQPKSPDPFYDQFVVGTREDGIMKCPGCGKNFKGAGGLGTHYKRAHGKNIKR